MVLEVGTSNSNFHKKQILYLIFRDCIIVYSKKISTGWPDETYFTSHVLQHLAFIPALKIFFDVDVTNKLSLPKAYWQHRSMET